MFGSEEYNDFVGSNFNDVFAFFVNGVNFALIPGTATPVSINNVNNGNANQGVLGSGPCANCAFYVDNATGARNTQLDGFTTVLTFVAPVNPGVSNVLKLAIADTSDSALDSAVFLQAGSLQVCGVPGTPPCTGGPTAAVPEPASLLLPVPVWRVSITAAAAPRASSSQNFSSRLSSKAVPQGTAFFARYHSRHAEPGCGLLHRRRAGVRLRRAVGRRARQRGDTYFASRRYQEAVVEYKSALQVDPQLGAVRLKLGDTYAALNEPHAARGEYIRAADSMPDSLEAQLKAGNALLMARAFEDAQARATRAISLNPKSLEAQVLRGNAMAGLKKFDEAIEDFIAAIALDPTQALVDQNLGTLQMASGDLKEAEAMFRLRY